MGRVTAYHRPRSVEDALRTLGAPGTRKVLLGGGTVVNGEVDPEPIEVIDLQALELDEITGYADTLTVGSGVTLQELADHPSTPPVLAELARREAPSTLRSMATVGGLVAHADPESELLAGLLVHEAAVTAVSAAGTDTRPLADVLAGGVTGAIVVEVACFTSGVAHAERTARTPADRPICAVVGRRDSAGVVRLAATGAGRTAVLFGDVAELDPSPDFRGTAEYRRHLLGVLARRVTEALA
jgi:CO/xanthine dehydrogenase FAD-binding subunit